MHTIHLLAHAQASGFRGLNTPYFNTPLSRPSVFSGLAPRRYVSAPVVVPPQPAPQQVPSLVQQAIELGWRRYDPPSYVLFKLAVEMLKSPNGAVGLLGFGLALGSAAYVLDKLDD